MPGYWKIRSARLSIQTLLLFCAGWGILTGNLACKKKAVVPQAVAERYQAHAHRLCQAIVECIKTDTAERLAEHPQRRDMVLARMSADLCEEKQYQLIGSLSTEPLGTGPAVFDEALYRRYGRCVDAVTSAGDCATRRERYLNDPECVGLRKSTPTDR